MENKLSDLPQRVADVLGDLVESAKIECGNNLVSIVLYGSAAEGRLRPTSDVNLILIFQNFDHAQIDRLREKLRIAYAAIQLNVMFVLESEISMVAEAFAVKFTDIISRHRILYGTDPFAKMSVSRSATLQRLRQVITNLTLRLRERYALVSLREEQLVTIIADVTGPLRASAFTILDLEDKSPTHPKEALITLAQTLQSKNWEKT